jgi:hypothetical protein
MTWFTRLRNWVTDQSNGIGIRADYHDSEDDNFATGINNCLNIAGLNSPTANIAMGGFKFTGAADGSSLTDFATLKQVQNQTVVYAQDSAGTDSYAITLSPAPGAYVTGQVFRFYPGTANTGAATLNVNSLGAKTIKKDKNTDLVDNDIQAGQLVEVIYDGTNFQLLSPVYGLVNQAGSAIYAADGGASDAYAITLAPVPLAYTTGMVIRFKANTANTGAASLNVNSLGAKTIKKDLNSDLSDNDILASQIVEVVYDGTNFQMLSQTSGLARKVDVQSNSYNYAADGAVTDAYTITLSPAPTAYTAGMVITFKANTANTGAATLNVNSLGAKTIKKNQSSDLGDNDILSGSIVTVVYDGTNFQIISFPASTAMFPVSDTNNILKNNSDTTKLLAFSLSGITTGTTRTWTVPDMNIAHWLLQRVNTQTGAVATGTTTMPHDDTIPQNTEGDQFMSLSITPKSTTSKLVIDVIVNVSSSVSNYIITALFQDSTANAIAVSSDFQGNAGQPECVPLRHTMTSGTTSATTFKVRVGANNANTMTFNGTVSARDYGGVIASSITISEYSA